MPNDQLGSWIDGAAKRAIVNFVADVTREGSPHYVPAELRVAVFDNDGTLWAEKPMPIELGFILQRLSEMVEQDASLSSRQPWKAAHSKDYTWLGDAMTKHYSGDDTDMKMLIGAILQAFDDMSVETYAETAGTFLQGKHPTLGRSFCDCTYRPMIELLRYLESNGFTNFIASGGDRDFMRTVTAEFYGIPAERVIGSCNALRYIEGKDGGSLVYQAKPDVFDDGPVKPVRIWSRLGRRPILAVGNSNGDIEMLQFAQTPGLRSLRMLVLHDDEAREFDYTRGAERALELAKYQEWPVISIKNDWTKVFAEPTALNAGH